MSILELFNFLDVVGFLGRYLTVSKFPILTMLTVLSKRSDFFS